MGSRATTILQAGALAVLMLVAGSNAGVARASGEDPVAQQIRMRIEAAGPSSMLAVDGQRLHAAEQVVLFYLQRSYRSAWTGTESPAPAARQLIEAIAGAGNDGLDPADYHLPLIHDITSRAEPATDEERAKRSADYDLLLTDAFLELANHFNKGRIDPDAVLPRGQDENGDRQTVQLLQRALSSGQVLQVLQRLLPVEPGYLGLRAVLQNYRRLQAEGGWDPVEEGPALRRGERGPRVAALRARLSLTHDLDPAAARGDEYDEGVEAAVRGFQSRHGLKADGVAGRRTLAALNLPAAARIEQIRANMERWRWLSRDLGRRYILVNIADFHLDVIEERVPVLSLRVIVGRPYRQTPAFSGTLTYVVFNPSWNIPMSIAVKEVLPGVIKDAGMLERERIRVLTGWGAGERELDPASIRWDRLSAKNFPYYFRQEPGPTNPLGRIKFMFPNRYNVYLHDTPSKASFRREVRGFSHGCIRLEHPLELAEYLFRQSAEWNRDSIADAMEHATDQAVFLPRAIPVHIVYWTAWVDSAGALQLRDDIYDRDRKLIAALAASPPGQ